MEWHAPTHRLLVLMYIDGDGDDHNIADGNDADNDHENDDYKGKEDDNSNLVPLQLFTCASYDIRSANLIEALSKDKRRLCAKSTLMFKILNDYPANGKGASKMNTHARDLKATRHEGNAENSVLPTCRVSFAFCTCGRACARVHYTRSFVTCRNYISFALAIQASRTANLGSSLVRRKTSQTKYLPRNRVTDLTPPKPKRE